MKLLFDENISYRVAKKVATTFPDCQPANRVRLTAKEDMMLWNFAKSNQFAIVTFDDDYEGLSQMLGWPPKVILLRPGNLSIDQIVSVLEINAEEINFFLNEEGPHARGLLKLFWIGSI